MKSENRIDAIAFDLKNSIDDLIEEIKKISKELDELKKTIKSKV